MKRKLLSTVLALAIVVALVGCGSTKNDIAPIKKPTPAAFSAATKTPEASIPAISTAGGKVGIALPTKELLSWKLDGSYMKEQLEKAGYEVDLQFAADDIPTQVSQIENMMNSGCKVLVIASVDGESLGTVLDQA